MNGPLYCFMVYNSCPSKSQTCSQCAHNPPPPFPRSHKDLPNQANGIINAILISRGAYLDPPKSLVSLALTSLVYHSNINYLVPVLEVYTSPLKNPGFGPEILVFSKIILQAGEVTSLMVIQSWHLICITSMHACHYPF